jgi:hypothetical protein
VVDNGVRQLRPLVTTDCHTHGTNCTAGRLTSIDVKTPHRDWWRAASVTRWPMPTRVLVVAVAALTVVLVAAIIDEMASSGVRSLPPPISAAEPQDLGNGHFRFFPHSGHASVGVPYQFGLYTHCGLDWPLAMDFDGSFWDPNGPASDRSGNPPAGFGNPYDEGTVTLISPTLAQYRSRTGTMLQWNRHAGPQISSLCS